MYLSSGHYFANDSKFESHTAHHQIVSYRQIVLLLLCIMSPTVMCKLSKMQMYKHYVSSLALLLYFDFVVTKLLV